MQVHIVSIGNELLIGDTINTNASWLGQVFKEAGLNVTQVHTVGDDLSLVKDTVAGALESADLVITTGGLGPTHDDITKQAVTELFECNLVQNEKILSFIKNIFKKRGLPFSKSNYKQAEVPDCCEVLFNKQGTAPGMWFERENAILVVLPGVPFEMKYLVNEFVLPRLEEHDNKLFKLETRYLITAGIGESTLSDEVLSDLNSHMNSHTDVAFLPSVRGVTLRINARGKSKKEAQERIDQLTSYIKEKAGTYFVGEGKNLQLAEIVGNMLGERGSSIATAESCTGGYIANELTNIPGCSHYLKGGVVAYSNEVKINQLGVDADAIESHGAVSKEVALQMAKGVARRLGADIGLSTTGIAGPTGGTREKPVGTVWIGYWSEDQHFALHAQFSNNRLINKERTSTVALDTVRLALMGSEETPYGLKKYKA